MKYLRISLLLLSTLLTGTLAAQSASSIIGKWQNKVDGAVTECYFFEDSDRLYGLLHYYKDEGEEFLLSKELKRYEIDKIEDLSSSEILAYFKEYVVFEDFEKVDNAWKGKYRHLEEGGNSSYDSKIEYIAKGQLKISLKYWGVWDASNWTRI